mmetsp:Transcript_35696/g.47077  ORF Transcript_35696/g.47077 Transcript_35696/m.47077 type:complete len:343 (+) Transcript_35696:66-1094(+)
MLKPFFAFRDAWKAREVRQTWMEQSEKLEDLMDKTGCPETDVSITSEVKPTLQEHKETTPLQRKWMEQLEKLEKSRALQISTVSIISDVEPVSQEDGNQKPAMLEILEFLILKGEKKMAETGVRSRRSSDPFPHPDFSERLRSGTRLLSDSAANVKISITNKSTTSSAQVLLGNYYILRQRDLSQHYQRKIFAHAFLILLHGGFQVTLYRPSSKCKIRKHASAKPSILRADLGEIPTILTHSKLNYSLRPRCLKEVQLQCGRFSEPFSRCIIKERAITTTGKPSIIIAHGQNPKKFIEIQSDNLGTHLKLLQGLTITKKVVVELIAASFRQLLEYDFHEEGL